MRPIPGLPTPEQFARRVLELHVESTRMLEEARLAGKRSDIATFERLVRRWDKLISQYGLHRFA